MKRVTLWSGGNLIREWAVDDVHEHRNGSYYFYTDKERHNLVQIRGTVVIEDREAYYGKAEE